MRTHTVVGGACLFLILLVTAPILATSAYAPQQGAKDLTASTGWFPGWRQNMRLSFQFRVRAWEYPQHFECYRGGTCYAGVHLDPDDAVQVNGQQEIDGKVIDLGSQDVRMGHNVKLFLSIYFAVYVKTGAMGIDGPAVLLDKGITWPDDADTDGEAAIRFKINDDAPLNSAITITIPMIVSVGLGFADGSWEKGFQIPAQPIYQTSTYHVYQTQAEEAQQNWNSAATLFLLAAIAVIVIAVVRRFGRNKREPAKGTVFCVQCGAANSSTDESCRKCGERLIQV